MRDFRVRLLTAMMAAIIGCVPSGRTGAGTGPPGQASDAATAPLTNLWTRTQGVDWPGFLGPDRNSRSSETGVLTDWSGAGPRIVWQREAGVGYGIGSVASGRYYHFDRFGDQARLQCLRAETGEELWRFEYPTDFIDMYRYAGGPRCSPVVDGDRVYVFGAEGMLHCLRVSDGTVIWRCDTAQQFGVVQNLFGVGSTPLVVGDLLITVVGGSPEADQNIPAGQIDRVHGNGTGIVAFDKYTGDVKYAVSNELAGYASPVVATIHGRRTCLALCRGGLVAVNVEKGAINFHYPWRDKELVSVNASTPVVVDNEVFLSEAYGPGSCLLSIQPGGYNINWRDNPQLRFRAMKAHFNTPIYHEGYLYGCSGRYVHETELRCLEWKTGKVMWSLPTGQRSSLLYVDQHLVNLQEHGKLQLIKANPRKFELVAEVVYPGDDATASQPDAGDDSPVSLLKYPCWAAPILSHGLLFVRGKDRLVCLELIPDRK